MLIAGSFRRALLIRLLRVTGAPAAAAVMLAATGCNSPKAMCIEWSPELGACLTGDEALEELRMGNSCEDTVTSVDSEPVQKDGSCCYEVTTEDTCCYVNCAVDGRPFVWEGERLKAAARPAEASWLSSDAARPLLARLSEEERAILGRAWQETALEEHASIASFSRFALELMALGAPSSLVEAAHAAALDEIGHARLCFSLASAYLGEAVGPGAFPVPRELSIATDLVALARATAEEGCVNETIATLIAAEKRDRAEDPAVWAALDVIAREEAGHAELAWRAVRWAIEVGGESVRRAVAEVFEAAAARLGREVAEGEAEGGARIEALAAHGRLSDAEVRRLSRVALREVVLPCARALCYPLPSACPPPPDRIDDSLSPSSPAR